MGYGITAPIHVIPTGIDLIQYNVENIDKETVLELKSKYGIKEDGRFKDVEYDQANQILTLTSSKDEISRLRKELYKIK